MNRQVLLNSDFYSIWHTAVLRLQARLRQLCRALCLEMGIVGTPVTITGQNFSDTPEENTITFGGGVEAGRTFCQQLLLLLLYRYLKMLPQQGPITVTVSGQRGTSSKHFYSIWHTAVLRLQARLRQLCRASMPSMGA